MKCPKCRAEIISDTLETCPYCGTPLAIPFTVSSEKGKKAERTINHETNEIAKKIREAIEAQKAFYKPEKADAVKKKEKEEKMEKMEKVVERKKYSALDIVILLVSIILTFIVLALTLSLILRR